MKSSVVNSLQVREIEIDAPQLNRAVIEPYKLSRALIALQPE